MRALQVVVVLLAFAFIEGLVPSSTSTADELMHSWYDSMGIGINPSVRLMTTPSSVAGRGVFAVEPLEEKEILANIPTYAMFHARNGEGMFPEVASKLQERMKCSAATSDETETETIKPEKKWVRFLRRIVRRKAKNTPTSTIDSNIEEVWQAELTEYALAALNAESEHPFEPWIRQWQRDDPIQQLFQKGSITAGDVEATAQELHTMVPDLSLYKILAAVNIRLEQYESFHPLLSNPLSSETAGMFTIVTSRTIGLADDIIAVIPFHDMLNHNFEPNVGIGFSDDGRALQIFPLRDIEAGEELFLCYTTIGREYDEDAAVWLLVQWGIPVPKSEWKVAKPLTVEESIVEDSN